MSILVSDQAIAAGTAANPGPPNFRPVVPMSVPALLHYWHVVLRWKYVIGGILLASLILGVVGTFLMTPKYTAITRIEISREQKNITKVEGLESPDAGRDLEFYQTQYSLLAAKSLAERVAKSLRLASNAAFFEAHGTTIASPKGFASTSSEARVERESRAVELLQRNLAVLPVRGSSLTDLAYTSASPQLAAKIANTWSQQFVEASIARRFESTADARKFLEARLAELRGRVESSERDLVRYAAEKNIVALGQTKSGDGKTEVDRTIASVNLEALNTALAEAIADRTTAQSRATSGSGGGESVEGLTNPAIASLRQKRAEMAAEYAKMMVQFEPGYPAARAIAEQVRALDTSISREETRVRATRTTAYTEAVNREKNLRQQVDALKQRLDLQQTDSIQYNNFQREADTNRQLYDALLQRYKEIGVASVGANNIAVVDAAAIPTRPSSPKLPINLALALVLGAALAAAVTFALEQIDEGLRDPDQISRLLQMPLLGSVPASNDEDIVEQLGDAKSYISEAYLSIRANLAFATDHGVPKIVMITSTRASEGKSTTTLALAAVLGRAGQRVLLIDGDMRSPSMVRMLDLAKEQGLANYLAGDDDWQKNVQATRFKGVDVLPAGPIPPSAADLLSSERIVRLMRSVAERYDHIVIDAPPVLGLADAPLLSRAVEGCVFVVEAGGVAVRGIKNAVERLRSVNAHIFGGILTKLDQRTAALGYGYSYGYGYGMGQSSSADPR